MTERPNPLSVREVRIRHEGAIIDTPDGVSFEVAPGEVVLLLGPSGSGKSTLALALNGLIPHAVPAQLTGQILVDGADTAERSVAQLSAQVGMVFQDPDAQIVTGTLLDEVCFGPENLEVSREAVLERSERALKRVGLWERRTENPDRLSGGGKQRLAIACALALEAPVIVLDEPTANLDPAGIEDLYAALAELVAIGDRSIVLVEHNLDAAIDLVDRVVVLDRAGRLALDGTVDEVIRGHGDALERLGVWMPVATRAGRRLCRAGIDLDPLPTTPAQLARMLDEVPVLPVVSPVASRAPSREPNREPRRSSESAVRVRQLTVTRQKRSILRDVDLDVEAGSFLAIVGVNGAGKTTLLQAIAGVAVPPRGHIQVAGLDPATADVRELARTIGFVFQNPEHQFIRYTVAEELAHGLEIQGVEPAEIAVRVDAMLARFGLSELRDAHPFLLSGGQKRRLSVGTALIEGAPVLALDEPTFGQDRERAAELLAVLADLNAEGTTVLAVTHDMQLVADYASHIAVLDGGALIGMGLAETILAGDLLDEAGLRPPPLAAAMRALTRHPEWRSITGLRDLPGGAL
ncbi:MAG: ABC transporter ATP-binding protein [Leucobacter sp.]